MNPEIKEKWVTALRSGEYKQGKGLLHNLSYNSWCCLGVLCDLAVKDGLNLEIDTTKYSAAATYDGYIGTPPSSVEVWASLNGARRDIDNLIDLNDEGHSFQEIAEYIETKL